MKKALINDLSRKIAESIGNFGWLDTPAPTIVVWSFVVFAVLPALRTWQIISIRHRVAVSVLPLFIYLLMTYLNLNTQKYGGNYGVQGRHLTPLIAGIPIVGGALWMPSTSTKKLFLLIWSLCLFLSGLVALRRYSVGVKQFNFFEMFSRPVWQPPLGIAGTLIALSTALLVLSTTFYLVTDEETAQTG